MRYRGLVSTGAVSVSAYDQIKRPPIRPKAELNAAQAQANVAQNATGYAVLLADADGVVMETLAEPGQVVCAGQPVVRLARAGQREGQRAVTRRYVRLLKAGRGHVVRHR